MNVEQLLLKYQFPFDEKELLVVFTHCSFSDKNHSRYVFLGMFGFKGLVADYIFHHIAGTGTQLQHFLGNVFKNSFLEGFFIKHHLRQYCRFQNIEITEQMHIFVYALFGYLYENGDAENLEKFILNEIVAPNDHLLPQNYKFKNRWDQLIFLCKQHFDQRPKLVYQCIENQHQFSVFIGDQILGQHLSVGYKYAKKKAINTSLRLVAEQLEEKLKKDDVYMANEKALQEKKAKEILEAKTEKQRQHISRNEDHAKRMREKQILAKQKAQEEDKKRREAKQIAKEKSSKKGKNTIYREYTTEEISAMSSAKRRNLQDRGILPKNMSF